MFTDIEGSTRLQLRLGERYVDVLSQHRVLLRAAISAHDGVEVSTEGDGCFFVFASAPSAVRAAVEAQLALRAHSWDPDAVPLVRIGLHTGEGTVVDDGYVGHAIHEAARIAASAHGRQIIVSDATAALVSGSLGTGVSLVDLGNHLFKDLGRPYRVFQVCHAGLDGEFPPLRTAGATRDNLPASTTRFIGRADELTALAKVVGVERIVTLTGPGGAGKTRLATEAARAVAPSYRGGVWFVDLAAVDSSGVAAAAARGIGLRDVVGDDLLAGITAQLAAGGETLLILDNCEHVLDTAADLVSVVVAATESVTVLATSREPLGLAGEQLWVVEPLDVPSAGADNDMLENESVRLFADRAALSRSDFRLTEDTASTVAAICRRLDGLPLGLELAAARLRSMTLEDLRGRLDDALSLSAGRRGDSRHGTLRAAIKWSHELLEREEQVVLARLSVFRGGFDLAAAAGVVADGHKVESREVVDFVSRLVDKSLVVLHDGSPARYRLLETIREFAEERLVELGERDVTRKHHLDWFCASARQQSELMLTPGAGAAITAIHRDHENVRAAIEWASIVDVAAAATLVRHLCRVWAVTGAASEGTLLAARVLEALPTDHPQRADALYALGVSLYASGGQLEPAGRAIEEALAAQPDDESLEAALLHVLGNVHARLGDTDRALAAWDDALAIRRRLGDTAGVLALLHNRATIFARTDRSAAVEAYADVIRFAEDRGATWLVGVPLLNTGVALRERGEFDAAREHYQRALEASGAAHDTTTETAAHASIGWQAAMTGDIDEANQQFDIVAARGIEHDRPGLRRFAFEARAIIALMTGDIDAAKRHASAALELTTRADADSLARHAIVAREHGDVDNTDRLCKEALAVASREDRPSILILAAETAVRRGAAEEGMALLDSIGSSLDDLSALDRSAGLACRAEIARARRDDDAEQTCRAAATFAGDLGTPWDEAAALRALAGVLVDSGRAKEASTVLEEERAVRGDRLAIPRSYLATYERDVAAVREQLL